MLPQVSSTNSNSSLCSYATVSDVMYIQMDFSEEKWGQWVIVMSNNQIIVFQPAVDYYWWQELPGGIRTLKWSEQCARTATAKLRSDPRIGHKYSTRQQEKSGRYVTGQQWVCECCEFLYLTFGLVFSGWCFEIIICFSGKPMMMIVLLQLLGHAFGFVLLNMFKLMAIRAHFIKE